MTEINSRVVNISYSQLDKGINGIIDRKMYGEFLDFTRDFLRLAFHEVNNGISHMDVKKEEARMEKAIWNCYQNNKDFDEVLRKPKSPAAKFFRALFEGGSEKCNKVRSAFLVRVRELIYNHKYGAFQKSLENVAIEVTERTLNTALNEGILNESVSVYRGKKAVVKPRPKDAQKELESKKKGKLFKKKGSNKGVNVKGTILKSRARINAGKKGKGILMRMWCGAGKILKKGIKIIFKK